MPFTITTSITTGQGLAKSGECDHLGQAITHLERRDAAVMLLHLARRVTADRAHDEIWNLATRPRSGNLVDSQSTFQLVMVVVQSSVTGPSSRDGSWRCAGNETVKIGTQVQICLTASSDRMEQTALLVVADGRARLEPEVGGCPQRAASSSSTTESRSERS